MNFNVEKPILDCKYTLAVKLHYALVEIRKLICFSFTAH